MNIFVPSACTIETLADLFYSGAFICKATMLGRRVKNIASSGLIKTARTVRHQFHLTNLPIGVLLRLMGLSFFRMFKHH
jgi:hypothetical protein